MNTPETNRENSTPSPAPTADRKCRPEASPVTEGAACTGSLPAPAAGSRITWSAGEAFKSATYQSLLRFDLKGNYCPGCMKLIIDTEIQK